MTYITDRAVPSVLGQVSRHPTSRIGYPNIRQFLDWQYLVCGLLYKLEHSCALFDLTERLKTEMVKTYLILLLTRDAESEPESEPEPD